MFNDNNHKADRPIWLTSLADADRGASPSSSVQERLTGRLRRRKSRVLYARAGVAALAAGLAVGAWVFPARITSHIPPETIDQDLSDAIAELMSQGDDTADFVPTRLASEQPLEAVRVVRVSLPGSALASYGIASAE